ncbi:hypothetical protein JAAARDRAFT_434212 [Jaapia argillacea MUCL 33604]|uniref:TIGR04076 family protein n=1 Tax=Jaapia argillacea MUCL 33604 TaxID=933084 RepID=A0A067PQ13_9AGAM|nr:hypothetical protein JAAARDRAFT_434212 [Jaapia argillacea MUCL 33604]
MTLSSPAIVDDSFQIYDLRVEVLCPPGERILCGAKPGDYFTLEGEMLYFAIILSPRTRVLDLLPCIPGAILPLLSGKQRAQQSNDWMTTDAEVACLDPHCKLRLRIVRTGTRTFRHGEVTAVPLPGTNLVSADTSKE